MTATQVDGRPVITDRDTTSDITDRAGRPVKWRQVRELTLDDGTVVYGCAHCDYTSPNRLSIRPHLNRHNRRPAAPAPGLIVDTTGPAQDPDPAPGPAEVAALAAAVATPAADTGRPAPRPAPRPAGRGLDADALTRDRDHWRARAQHAERLLADLAAELGLTSAAEPAA